MVRSLFLLIILPVQLFAQIIPLRDYDLPQALISHTQLYPAGELNSFLSTGSDLYLEYVFRNLLVQDVRFQDGHFTVEVYEMDNPSSAYGIYSVSVMNCKARNLATAFDCFSGNTYRAAAGRYYIRISSDVAGPNDRSLFTLLSGKIIGNNPDTSFLMPSEFTSDLIGRFGKSPYYMKGVLGLQHSPFSWQDLFTLVRATIYAIILPFERDVYFAKICFAAESDKNTFLKRAGLMSGFTPMSNTTTSSGLYREFRQIDNSSIYFLECQLPFSISSLVP